MVGGRLREGRAHEQAMRQRPVVQLLATGEDACAAAAQLSRVAGVVVVARAGGDRTQPGLAPRGTPDAYRGDLPDELVGECVGDLPVHVQTRKRRALLPAHAESG